MPQSIPAGLKRDHALKTLADLDAGIDHAFGQPTRYELVHEGRRYAPKAVIGLAVNVEQDDIGVGNDRSLDVAKEHGVLDLALKKLDRLLVLAVERMGAVPQEVRQDFEQVRLAGTEEARNPNAHLAGRIGILSLIDGFQIPRDELAEMLVEFSGDDELIQLLPDGRIVKLVRLRHAVNGAEDVTFKKGS